VAVGSASHGHWSGVGPGQGSPAPGQQLPIAKLFNTSGESYRAGEFKARLRTMSEGEALQALAADGKLLKRPIVDSSTKVLVGFDEDAFARQFG